MEQYPAIPIADILKRGRGATLNPAGRFEEKDVLKTDDGWEIDPDSDQTLKTSVIFEQAKTAISRNHSPDLPFDRSVNPYRGCEHGCIYCFARPSHSYMNLSAGLDFESKLFAKPNIAKLLEAEISRKGYHCRPLALGTNTDPYQPIERKHGLTRQIVELLCRTNHPFTITTKSDLVLRDLDLLAPQAQKGLVAVGISLTSLENDLSRKMEPRASAPHKRLCAIQKLSEAGIPVVVQIAPVIPAINDMHLEKILKAAAEAGASGATYLLVRLPYEVSDLFKAWLEEHFPDRASKVMNCIRSMRKGRENDPNFGSRMRGSGPYADLIENRFSLACKKYNFSKRKYDLPVTFFTPPSPPSDQLSLF